MRERTYGPMHGERTARHQMICFSNSRRLIDGEGIFTAYEVTGSGPDNTGGVPMLRVEVMVDGYTNALEMTVDEARFAAGVFADFVAAWQNDR